MNPYDSNTNIYNFINQQDLQGLQRISKIKENQVVDINENGTISEPYDAGGWDVTGFTASAWRTGLALTGYAGNRDDLPKIKSLMQRALIAYRSGCEPVKNFLNNAIPGLENLKKYYLNKHKDTACKDIDVIVNFISTSIIEIEKTGFKNASFKEIKRHKELNLFEASCIGSAVVNQGTYGPLEGVTYYRERIKDFLFLEKGSLAEKDISFLNSIDNALEKAKKNYDNRVRSDEIVDRANLIMDGKDIRTNRESWIIALDQANNELDKELAISTLDDLNSMPPDQQQQIGIQFPMRWGWEHERQYEGHIFFINVCKDADGTYTVAQANAGGLALGDIASLSVNMNFNAPITINLSTIVEFRGLTRDEATNFLIKVKNAQTTIVDNRLKASERYQDLFASILDKKSIDRIPPRRQQIVNNCGVRSEKELLIYAFQKSDNIALANQFLKYTDGRGRETLAYEEVKPLLK